MIAGFRRQAFGFSLVVLLVLGYTVTAGSGASAQVEEIPYVVTIGRYFIEIVSGLGTVLDTYGKVKADLPSRPLTGHEEYLLGFAYLTGTNGNKVNYELARAHFDAAVRDHYYRAWIGLGIMYRTGRIAALEGRAVISPQDLSMAAREFYSVIEEPETAGDRVAEYDLGYFWESKGPSKKYYSNALYWYDKSSAQGFAPAASAIHRVCATAEGVSGDLGFDCYRPKLVPLKTRKLNTPTPMP